ncbi:unnamed protein product [Closterium sp. Naga37s-1]|nr:unnamed protein product [Closterium sp. Naga37s-1]
MPPRPVNFFHRSTNLRSTLGQTRGSTSCSTSPARSSQSSASSSSSSSACQSGIEGAAADEARRQPVLTAGETISRCLATPTTSPIWPLSTPPCSSSPHAASPAFFSPSWRPLLPLSTSIATTCLASLGAPCAPDFNAGKETPWCLAHGGGNRPAGGALAVGAADSTRAAWALPRITSAAPYGTWRRVMPCAPPAAVITRRLHDAQLLGQVPGLAFCSRPVDGDADKSSGAPEAAKEEEALRLVAGACVLPHPDKLDRGGEDAFFILPDVSALGVADGVGGWADVGVDAGAYARELMGEVQAAVRREPKGCADTLRVLTSAHAKTRSQGSCTACLVVLTADRLQAANLGDSGFVVVRNGRIIFKSPPQQHDFNFPFQLGSDGGDSPSAAEVFSLPVAAGDVVVLGTDGLFDNVFDSELASTVMHSLLAGREPQHTAEHIATLARTRAQDRIRISPFARAAQEAGYRYYGGKLDDITVVVAYVAGPKFGPGWWRNCR